MNQFIEYIPIALFVVVYFTSNDIYLATAVLMVGVCVQVGVEYAMHRSLRKQTQVIFLVAVVFGGMTLAFQNDLFIKWKPTIVNWVFGLTLLLSQFVAKDNLLKKLLGEQMSLPDHVWRRLNYGWSLGFFLAGVLNLVVAYSFDTDFWVTYKLIGGIAITLAYIIITVAYLIKGGYIQEETADKSSPD